MTLYNKYEALNERGCDIAEKVDRFFSQLIVDNPDCELRELMSVARDTVSARGCEEILRKGIRMRKAEANSGRT